MIYIAFGANLPSNIGSPDYTYQKLPDILRGHRITVEQSSSLYRTAPVPISDQPDYMNAVMAVSTAHSASDLMQVLLDVEASLGRQRNVQNAARGIDLDLIAYHDQISDCGHATLPHPRMHERLFVLQPLAEIAPDWFHPILKQNIQSLLRLATQQAA